jgi:hypothetical protein
MVKLRIVSNTVRPAELEPRPDTALDLNTYAKQVWPEECGYLRWRWVRAVLYLRTTKKGWLIDQQIKRMKPPV